MSLTPYNIDRSLRRMERGVLRSNDFFGPSPFNQLMPRDFFSPYFNRMDNVFRPWEKLLEPIQRMTSEMNRLALDEFKNISSDKEKFQINVDVQHFAPEEIKVTVKDGHVVVLGEHEEKQDDHGYISRQFMRRYPLPKECLPDTVESQLSSDGVLTVTAPKVLALPSTGERIVPITHTGPVQKKLDVSS